MFGKQAAEQVEVIPTALLKPEPFIPQTSVVSLGRYEALAKELKFMPAQLLEEQLLRFLAERKILIYDYAQVDAYLIRQASKKGKFWIWRPLRESDKPRGWAIMGHNEDGSDHEFGRGHGSYRDEPDYRPYSRAVPIRILQQVQTIQDRFGGQVLFFVSDYAVPRPDPFIMVTTFDVKKIIFGVWDEPAFDEAPVAGGAF